MYTADISPVASAFNMKLTTRLHSLHWLRMRGAVSVRRCETSFAVGHFTFIKQAGGT
jgi:hypothetical protein